MKTEELIKNRVKELGIASSINTIIERIKIKIKISLKNRLSLRLPPTNGSGAANAGNIGNLPPVWMGNKGSHLSIRDASPTFHAFLTQAYHP
jgi:hypothetical protein